MTNYELRYVAGHVEVYLAGEFQFSADSEAEARRELFYARSRGGDR